MFLAYYTANQMHDISEAYLTDAGGEAVAKATAPIVTTWNHAVKNGDEAERKLALAFRTDLQSYGHAWDFMSQIIDFRDPRLHRRAIVAGLLARNMHSTSLIETIDTSSVELTGLAIVANEVDADHSMSQADPTDFKAPAYDGDRTLGGSKTPEQVALSDAIDEVNRLFSISGLDLGNGSGEAWTRAVWGVLSDDDEVKAMTAENTDEQLQASPKFKDKVTGAVVAVATDSAAMTEAAMSNAELYDGLVELMAKVTAIVNGTNVA